ncbi:helix-turn-helix domain-containing protein [Persicobacter diffluens]|uniref:HTH hxlR-type domain-containing protein n=1 Tax=Persicobacter diffluens TaxID=981 RepID=A0AAN4W290_9BACT|nr:hypothetical protein PEDI_35240 [Persicobacter diffluens]
MRSDCPISFLLDLFGDKWSFLVIRDLLQGKKFYKEFSASKEGIATNILSDRLKKLEANGIVVSKVCEELRTKKEYSLTEKGKDLIPIIIDMILWSDKYQEGLDVPEGLVEREQQDRQALITEIKAGL